MLAEILSDVPELERSWFYNYFEGQDGVDPSRVVGHCTLLMHVLSKSRNPNPLLVKLLSQSNNVNAVDSTHQNALYKASKNPACDDQTFKILIDFGAELPQHSGVKKQFLTEMFI